MPDNESEREKPAASQAKARIPPRSPWERAYPTPLREKDEKAIVDRRTAAGFPNPSAKCPIGLAFSGGGIRSATFSLGVLQALAGKNLLRQIDYLSTVSGGGYIGSFLGALFTRGSAQGTSQTPAEVESILKNSRSEPVDWLRENGRYLSPNGAGDLLLAGAVGLRNWAAIQVVLGTLFLTLFLLLEEARRFAAYWQVTIPEGGFLVLLAILFVLAVLPLGWSYWLGQSWKDGFGTGWTMPPWLVGVAALVLSVTRLIVRGGVDKPALLLAVASAMAFAYMFAALFSAKHQRLGTGQRDMNNVLSRWLKGALVITGAVLTFWAVDALGSRLYDCLRTMDFSSVGGGKMSLSAIAAGLLVFGRKIASFLASSPSGKGRLRLPLGLLAGAAALALATGVLVLLSAVAHGFADGWNGAFPDGLHWATVAGIVLTLILGRTFPFLNQSSLQALYAARLTRAYLGASNHERWKPESGNLTDLVRGDGIAMADYKPHESGGPIHLINVTLNETISGKSQIEQRDRKGLGMAVGPNAYSVGARHHLLLPEHTPAQPPDDELAKDERDDFWIFPRRHNKIRPEELDLGTWISVSGAAFTTGLGSRTSLGLSLLCGFFNVRIGYWWNSRISPRWRSRKSQPNVLGQLYAALTGALPVQMHLLDEFLARFSGPASELWYLSDGGHFENTACYELIRRRLPLIIVCDDGADPEYHFADLANLVRKARIDFCTEIEFLDEAAISKWFSSNVARFLAPLRDLRPQKPHERLDARTESTTQPADGRRFSLKHAAVARINYLGGAEGWLIVLKPTLSADAPADLIEYHSSHPAFPQEPTSEQFFDEAQWESYRKLGETIGDELAEAVGGHLASLMSPPRSESPATS
jgi:hypothetical protein